MKITDPQPLSAPEIFIWGVIDQRVWETCPSGIQRRSPGRGSGDEVP